MATSNAGDHSGTPWFYDMAFRGYWDHWRHVQSWLTAAQYAYEKADEAKADTIRRWRSANPACPGFSKAANTTAKERRHEMRAERRKKQKRKKRNKERKARRDNEEEEEVEDDEEDASRKPKNALEAACDDQEEFLKLLAQNRAFRQERDAYKREEEKQVKRKEYLSSQTPVEQAGLKRTREMSDLYGGESILIQTCETNLQMKFDEFSDTHQPPLWPSIPLNLGYGR